MWNRFWLFTILALNERINDILISSITQWRTFINNNAKFLYKNFATYKQKSNFIVILVLPLWLRHPRSWVVLIICRAFSEINWFSQDWLLVLNEIISWGYFSLFKRLCLFLVEGTDKHTAFKIRFLIQILYFVLWIMSNSIIPVFFDS